MFDKTLLNSLKDKPQPKYILLNHAIDLATGNIERPYYIFYYKNISESLELDEALVQQHITYTGLDEHDLLDVLSEKDIQWRRCVNKISQAYSTGQIPVYLSPLSTLERKHSFNKKTNERNNVDYPIFKIDTEKKCLQNIFGPCKTRALPKKFSFIAPADYKQVSNLLTGENQFPRKGENVFICDGFYSIRLVKIDSINRIKKTPCLLFLETSDVKKLFPQKSENPDETRGRSKAYTELESLIVYLKSKDVDLSCFDDEKQESFRLAVQAMGNFGGDTTVKKHYSDIKKAIEKVNSEIKFNKSS